MKAKPMNPIVSRDYRDMLTPGVVVELTPDEAESLGLQEELALSEKDAWESNGDPAIGDPDPAVGGL